LFVLIFGYAFWLGWFDSFYFNLFLVFGSCRKAMQ
jgi:hypothetical protein